MGTVRGREARIKSVDTRESLQAILTSAPGDIPFFLRDGEGSAKRRGVGPPFFRCSTEGDFGTVHTGAPSGRRWVRLGPSRREWVRGDTVCVCVCVCVSGVCARVWCVRVRVCARVCNISVHCYF